MKKVILLLTGCALWLGAISQNKVRFVEDISKTGEPIGESAIWSISPEGNNIYVLYSNNDAPITLPVLGIVLQRQNNEGIYEEYDNFTVETDSGQSWVFFKIRFTNDGYYRLIMRGNNRNLAVGNVEIVYQEVEVVEEAQEISKKHIKGYTLNFYDSVDANGYFIESTGGFRLTDGELPITVYIRHSEILKFKQFTIDIKQIAPDKKPVETLKLTVSPSQSAVYYEYIFTETGTYEVTVLLPDGREISKKELTIF